MRQFLVSVAAIALAVACQKGPAEAQATPKAAPGDAPEAATAQKDNAEAALYAVRIVPGDATAGAEATSVIEVTPAAGYKINLEFPTRLKLSTVDGIAHAKAELGKTDAEITEKVLRFNVAFTAAKAGKFSLEGVADFSVCNDRTCRLLRGEKLAWEVAVK